MLIRPLLAVLTDHNILSWSCCDFSACISTMLIKIMQNYVATWRGRF